MLMRSWVALPLPLSRKPSSLPIPATTPAPTAAAKHGGPSLRQPCACRGLAHDAADEGSAVIDLLLLFAVVTIRIDAL
jgi:hypothetical protein